MTPDEREEVEGIAEAYVTELHAQRLAYRPAEAARLLGVDERTVYRLIASGQLTARRISARLTLVTRQALFDFLGVANDGQAAAREVAR